jgi:nucleotide-binding universal stress UspA family protein
MFHHILIPLDGSRLAESAIPAAVYLCKTLHASATLIHIIEQDAPADIHGERHLSEEQDALNYLDKISHEFFNGINVRTHVHSEHVNNLSQSIIDHGNEFDHDLIVMCSHGHGGFRKAITGSIAQQIITKGKIPLLLIQPDEGGRIANQIFKILVALDSDPEHESGLYLASELAQALHASVHLVHVIQDMNMLAGLRAEAGRILPMAAEVMMEMNETGGRKYLKEKADWLVKMGIPTSFEIRKGDSAIQIARSADAVQADLIVLGTHGKSGIHAFWSGSVAPKVASATHTPLLLTPVSRK